MMQDNSFEKNIDQQLHDIQIEPSTDVWNAVEKALEKKKRRYLFGWWWLPAVLFTVGSLVFLMNYFKQTADKQGKILSAHKTQAGQDSFLKDRKNVAEGVTGVLPKTSGDREAVKPLAGFTVTNNPVSIVNLTPGSKRKSVKRKARSDARQQMAIRPADEDSDAPATKKISPALSEKNTEQFNNNKTGPSATTEKVPAQTAERKELNQKDSLARYVPAADKESRQSKWKKELSVSGGVSGFASFNAATQDPVFLYIPNNQGSPNAPADLIERTSYNFTAGVNLAAGFDLGRSFSKRFSVFTGLHYNYQSVNVQRHVRIDTATVVGTSVSYTTVSNTSYNERLRIHSINIPMLLRFSPANRVDINAGLYNYISVSSNWNKYNHVLGKQKTYLPVFHLEPALRMGKLSMGPFVNIGLSKYATGQRLLNYGLTLRYAPKK